METAGPNLEARSGDPRSAGTGGGGGGLKRTPLLRTFRSLLPPHITEVDLLWVPGHAGITFNETADSLARVALSGPVVDVIETTPLLAAARFRRLLKLQRQHESVLLSLRDFCHLKFSWKPNWCPSRDLEVIVTSLRCRVPQLNRYLHRSRLAQSAMCSYCNEEESVDHFLLSCRRFSSLRRQLLEVPLHRLGLALSVPVLLSFGASETGYGRRDVCSALLRFIENSKRFTT